MAIGSLGQPESMNLSALVESRSGGRPYALPTAPEPASRSNAMTSTDATPMEGERLSHERLVQAAMDRASTSRADSAEMSRSGEPFSTTTATVASGPKSATPPLSHRTASDH